MIKLIRIIFALLSLLTILPSAHAAKMEYGTSINGPWFPTFESACASRDGVIVNGRCMRSATSSVEYPIFTRPAPDPVCKEDEVLKDGQCRPKNPCGSGQHEEGGACVPDQCKPGEIRVAGFCVPDPDKPTDPDKPDDDPKQCKAGRETTIADRPGTAVDALCMGGCVVTVKTSVGYTNSAGEKMWGGTGQQSGSKCDGTGTGGDTGGNTGGNTGGG